MPSRTAGLCTHIVGPALSLAPLLWQAFTANERALLLALIHPSAWKVSSTKFGVSSGAAEALARAGLVTTGLQSLPRTANVRRG
jgi:hypothetical protein